MIKSAKRAISAILGNVDITDEELLTTIIGAEGLINSRPLTYQSTDPADDVPLTPNHFLHEQIGGQFAPTTVDDTQFNLRKSWRRVQELVRHFWKRWLQEWLPSLGAPRLGSHSCSHRFWHRERRDIRIGEVVLIVSTDTSRGNWPLGRAVEVYPGIDGRVCVAKLQVGQGMLVRPVTKLCPLESTELYTTLAHIEDIVWNFIYRHMFYKLLFSKRYFNSRQFRLKRILSLSHCNTY